MPAGDDTRYLSTVEAAASLGVSVSTIKRWVDEGILPAHRTAGGHRKISSEVLALARQGALVRGDLTARQVVSARDQPIELESAAAALRDALPRGEATEASADPRHLPLECAARTLADQVIAPVMAQVGHDWETSRIDVWQEHRVTQLCAGALYDLKDELESAGGAPPTGRGSGTAPEGDPYLLPTLLAQLVLLDAGWEAINLGPHTPFPSLTKAMRELRPRLLWLSVSHVSNPAEFTTAYRPLYRAAENRRRGCRGRAGAGGVDSIGDSLYDVRGRTQSSGRVRADTPSQAETAEPRPTSEGGHGPAESTLKCGGVRRFSTRQLC